ncbi:MAG: tetratricopeptide repeat protein [Planctomycetota bacterium]
MIAFPILLTILAQTAQDDGSSQREPLRVQSRVFDIEYDVNDAARPLQAVELWYTLNDATTWHLYGQDDDLESPFSFNAPNEGRYGFYFVIHNATGQSGAVPDQATIPHLRAFVDFTPPIAQLHTPRHTRELAQEIVQIRWALIDAHLTDRPIEVEYRTGANSDWQTVTEFPLANTGRYDWRPPEGLRGVVDIRIRARDKGGHTVTSATQRVQILEPKPVEPEPSRKTTLASHDREKTQAMLAEAISLRNSGLYRESIAQLRKVVRADPQMTDAFAEMADIFYRIEDMDRAMEAYEIALGQSPQHRRALRGSAMILSKRRDYESAAERLRVILKANPKDAEVWMNLGDVAIFRGDEITARASYQKAIEVDPDANAVIADARKRLELMAKVSRQYH